MEHDINAITQLRLQLLANGYTPIRNRDKRTFMKGWPQAVVDEGEIARWDRRFSRDKATGIRVEDGLAVIDFDIDDPIIDRIVNAIMDAIPELEKPDVPLLVRAGKGRKEAWFVRTDEVFSRIHSRAWLAPGTSADDGAHRVEIFGGASPRQFGSFGPHTLNDDGSVKVWYRWADRSPADTLKSELPALTKAQFFQIADIVERELEKAGWTPVAKTTKGENDVQRIYDLAEDMSFDIDTGERLSLLDLRERAAAAHDAGLTIRCSASWLEGPSAKRTDRCIVGIDHGGEVFIHEFNTGTHCPASSKPADRSDPVDNAAKLAEKMQQLGMVPTMPRDPSLVIKPNDGGRDVARKLLHLYAYCPSASKPVVPISPEAALPAMPLKAFTDAMTKYAYEVPAGGNKTKRVNPVSTWLNASSLQVVAGVRMRPDRPAPLYDEGSSRYVNIYTAPVHDAAGGSADIGMAFMEQLAPVEDERRYLLQWLSYKFRHPAVRGPALVMVAHERFGTGRGLFGQLLRQLFGSAYVQEISYSKLAGKDYQSQYTEWLSENLIVIVNESAEVDAGATSYRTKHNTYEHLKTIVEPGATETTITRKGDKSTKENVFASFVIATNHSDALPIPAGDRRFAIISNGEPREQAYWDELVAWMLDRANIAAFARELLDVDLAGYSPHVAPPAFRGKLLMADMARSELDKGLDAALELIKSEVFTLDQIVAAMRKARAEYGLEYPDRWEGLAKKLAARQLQRVGVPDSTNWQVFIGGRKQAVYVKTTPLRRKWETRAGLREAVLEGFDASDTGEGANVVSLSERLSLVTKTKREEPGES